MTMPIRPGPWAFLSSLGQAANNYATTRENMRRRQFSEDMKSAGTIMDMISEGFLPKSTMGTKETMGLLGRLGVNYDPSDIQGPSAEELKANRLAEILPQLQAQEVPDVSKPLNMQTRPMDTSVGRISVPTNRPPTRMETGSETLDRVGVGTAEAAALGLTPRSTMKEEEATAAGVTEDIAIGRASERLTAYDNMALSAVQSARASFETANPNADFFEGSAGLDAAIENAKSAASADGYTWTRSLELSVKAQYSQKRSEVLSQRVNQAIASAQAQGTQVDSYDKLRDDLTNQMKVDNALIDNLKEEIEDPIILKQYESAVAAIAEARERGETGAAVDPTVMAAYNLVTTTRDKIAAVEARRDRNAQQLNALFDAQLGSGGGGGEVTIPSESDNPPNKVFMVVNNEAVAMEKDAALAGIRAAMEQSGYNSMSEALDYYRSENIISQEGYDKIIDWTTLDLGEGRGSGRDSTRTPSPADTTTTVTDTTTTPSTDTTSASDTTSTSDTTSATDTTKTAIDAIRNAIDTISVDTRADRDRRFPGFGGRQQNQGMPPDSPLIPILRAIEQLLDAIPESPSSSPLLDYGIRQENNQ